MERNYTHASEELLRTETIKLGVIPEKSQILVRNDKGEMEEKDLSSLKLTKGEIFTSSAGYHLLADVGKYVCTHMPDKLHDKSLWYYEITLSFDDFVRMAIGEESGFFIEKTVEKRSMYPELKQKIYRLFSDGEGKCLMKEKDGKLVYDAPFRWGLEPEDNKEFLSAGMVKKLDNIDRKKIKNIRLSFHKAIFGEFVAGSRYFQYPSCLYARICTMLSTLTLDNMRHLEANEVAAQARYERMRNPFFIGGYVSAIAKLYLSHAGIPTREEVEEFVQSDGKSCQKSKRIEIDFRNFLTYVMPRLIRQRNSKVEIRNPFDTDTFFHSLSYITNLLDGLDFKIKAGEDGWKLDYKKEKITWEVTHSPRILKVYADKRKHMK